MIALTETLRQRSLYEEAQVLPPYSLTVTKLDPERNESGAHAAQGRMFVPYPQSGNGQRQVMCERNMFLPFHIHRVSQHRRAGVCSFSSHSVVRSPLRRARRDPRVRGLSLSLSSHRLAKRKCCSFRWLLSFFSALGRAVSKAAASVWLPGRGWIERVASTACYRPTAKVKAWHVP